MRDLICNVNYDELHAKVKLVYGQTT